ncbi:hypothetical protein FACS1894192_03900 [Bacilli bacterium]|nr:hypothetical protein FACS1894192_03900 [Bacilli bacterium]
MNETEIGQAIQMLGFTYASYKITTASGTKQINNIPVGENAGNHLKNVEGFGKNNGISGAHNGQNFMDEIGKLNAKITSEKVNSAFLGIKEVEYRVPQKLPGGVIKEPIEYTSKVYKKTIYDSSIVSDKQIFEWGQEAMKNGKIVGNKIYGTASNGLKFEGYYRNGEITNFFPVLN